MNYLVTGAAGFIGAAIAERLVAEGHSVVTVDNLSTGYAEHVPAGVRFIEGNCADSDVIARLDGEKFDAVIHIAGQSSGEISFDDPVYDLQANAQSTLLLLDYARKTGCKKFIYASTVSVYGQPDVAKCNESTEPLPMSFYAVGKLASEHYMRLYAQEYGMTCTAFRFFHIYGIGQNMRNLRQGMVSIYMAMAVKDHKIIVKGSKDRFRDYVYIDDLVNAILLSLDRTDGYDVFNIATGVRTTVEDVINTMRKFLPFNVEVEYTDGTPGDVFGVYGDNEKLKRTLGWKPVTDVEAGIKKMTEWALQLGPGEI